MAEPVGGAKKQNKTLDDALGVAELQESGANYEEAIRSFRGALELGPKGEDKARALRGVGSCLERLGRWKEAHSVLSDAYRTAEEIQSDAEICRIQIKLGKIELGQGNIDAAIRRGNDTLSRIDAGADVSASTRGFALNLLGSAHNRKGNLQESAHCFEQALSAFKDAGDVRSLALAYNNLGLIYKEKCEWARALEHLQVASNLQAVEGDYPKRRSGRHNLGVVHFRMGHLEQARTCFTEAEDIARGVNDPVQVIRALLGRAGVDLVQHRWEEALEELEQVLELCSEENYPREAALTYRSLGQLHQARGNLRRAKRCFEVAWRKAIEISTEGDLVRELLRLRAELELAMGRPEEAESLALRAEELATQNGDKVEIALSQVVLGQVRVVLGKEEGFGTLQGGHRQLRVLGSPLPLVQALMCEARLRLEFDAGLDLAETALRDAREILQPVGLTELEVESLLLLTEVASRRLDFDRATEYMDLARGMVAQGVSQDIKSRFDLAQEELEAKLVDSSVTNLGAYRTAGRLEELIESSRSSSSKIIDVLELLTSALEADGSALISLDETIETTTHRIGSAAGKMLEQLLVRENLDRPVLVLDAENSRRKTWVEMAGTRQASSLMVVPIPAGTSRTYLYLDRLAAGHHSAFGPSHLNLCLALVNQLSTLIERIEQEKKDLLNEDALDRRIYLADVVTQNAEMVRILKLVEKVSNTDLTVLLQGETGTGKTLIARAIHLTSDRAEGAFVTVDCAALPENLLESELFGYVKGAFTGAQIDKKGLFEEADGGTIFLDEIGKAGLGVQRRLLHLLDRGEVRPVGSTSYRKLNVRVICATSKENLLSDPEAPFIKDLFYRLNDIIVQVPSLADRPEDIPLLTEYFLEMFKNQTGREFPNFSRAAMQRLVRYSWPGNVRELEKAVRRAAILSEDGEAIGVELLPAEIISNTEVTSKQVPTSDGLRGTVQDMERRMVLEALEANNWNKTRAAESLGLSRKGLKNKITRYGLTPRGA